MSYGSSLREMGASAAELIAKIWTAPDWRAAGEQPRFELVINLKTARALGPIPLRSPAPTR